MDRSGIEAVKARINISDVVRRYVDLKPVSGPADLEEPLIMRTGAKVEDVCRKLHRDFVDKFRFARIWGDSVRHEAQRVGLAHTLADEDILQIVIER